MPTSPFDRPGRWYRGNLHGHTTESDGRFSPAEYAAAYRALGHDFTAATDHRRLTDLSAFASPEFLCLPGIEIDGPGPGPAGCDVVGIGLRDVPSPTELGSLQGRIDALRARGAVAIIAHPYETGLTSAELLAHDGYIGLEVWNSCSTVRWGKGLATVQWDEMLQRGRWTAGLVTDDSHHRVEEGDDVGLGWVCVRAPALTAEAILQALAEGCFYGSCGPEIHDVRVEREAPDGARGVGWLVTVRCSPCRRVHLLADRGLGRAVNPDPGQTLTEARLRLPPAATYLRVECLDAEGRLAWTNPLPLGPSGPRAGVANF